MSQMAAKPPLGGSSVTESQRNESLLKLAKGTGTAVLMLTYFAGAGVVILLTYLGLLGDAPRRAEFLPWLTCSLLIIVLGAQSMGEMRVHKRLDALLTLLTRKRLFDDEVMEARLILEPGDSADKRAHP